MSTTRFCLFQNQFLVALLAVGCRTSSPHDVQAAPPSGLNLVKVGEGFTQPTDIQPIPGSKALVVLGKKGTAWRWEPGSPPEEWFRIPVASDSELGLLGMAFPSHFARTGIFYVHYNPAGEDLRTRIAEWKNGSPPQELRVLLEVEQPYSNHNGGQIRIGPDGMLYIGLGDGGAAGDPHGYSQNKDSLLGKLLRLDPATGAAPADNPWVGEAGVRPELWAVGLRNPWKFWIHTDGSIFVADVGQDTWEEVDRVHRGDNLGWRVMEGEACFEAENCARDGLELPIATYGRDQGVSITGGVVPSSGVYADQFVYADFGTGNFWAVQAAGGGARFLGKSELHPSTFGLGVDGTVYVADFGTGDIYRMEGK